MPVYRDAVYGGETVILENRYLRLEIHKRLTGWGWGELFVVDNNQQYKFMAVLEYLAEADISGFPHPLRLEAKEYKLEKFDDRQELSFEVELQPVDPPSEYLSKDSVLRGTVRFVLPHDKSIIHYEMSLRSECLIYLNYIRGPWLRIGANSFGIKKYDAIFPGVEWVVDDEWSSGTDWFEHPQALRVTPHPYKVAIPVMAISYDGIGIGLSWNPEESILTPWTSIRCPQPVFATPNFIDHRNHHLLGLMYPSVRWGMDENYLRAKSPILVRRGVIFPLHAQISVVKGTSLDVILDWVKRNGLPDPGPPRYEWKEALDRIAKAYNTNLWIEGKGWGIRGEGQPIIPDFISYYIEHGTDQEVISGLKEKVAWCKNQKLELTKERSSPLRYPYLSRPLDWILTHPEDSLEIGNQLLKIQTPEGDFPFDPSGRHSTLLQDWANIWRPLGHPGDSAIDLCATASASLILAGRNTGESKFIDAARKTLEFAMRFERPEGGDWWETPLSSPNLLAAGHAAIAYYLGYQEFNDRRYLEKAIRWIRSIIPFTHLWQPADIHMIYNTKPCFCSTSWFLSDWVSKHVQWEVLQIFAKSAKIGIDWAEIDQEIDWGKFQKGVTTAVLRWMIDSKDPEWLTHSEYPLEFIKDGKWDTLFADTFDPVNNTYGGGPIMPELIADNVIILLKKNRDKKSGR
jgi:hypothetical protein